jgi:hypothetical protein
MLESTDLTERGKPPEGFCKMWTGPQMYCWRPAARVLRLGCQHEHLIPAELCPRCVRFVEQGRMECGDCATARPELIQPWMNIMPRAQWMRDKDGVMRRPTRHTGCVFAVIPEPAEPAEPIDNVQIYA